MEYLKIWRCACTYKEVWRNKLDYKNCSVFTVVILITVINIYGEEWKFGLMGDTQWKDNEDGRNPNSVAVGIIRQVNAQFIKHKVKFVFQVGDLVNSYSTAAFDTRAQAAKELLNAGIGFFPLRGNHESSGNAAEYFPTAFPQSCGHTNTFETINFQSPSSEFECLSYSFDYNNARFVLLDQFTRKDGSENTNNNIIDQLSWINRALTHRSPNTHAFVLAHKNLIGQNHSDILLGEDPSSNISAQNFFFRCLYTNGVRYFFSGHDHMHFRSVVFSPDNKYRINQLIAASNSYKFYTPISNSNDEKYNLPPRERPITEELYSIGYYIFTVNDALLTADFYSSLNGCGGTWGEMEECELSKTPTLSFVKRETFGYSLNGKDYIIGPDQSFTIISDTCPVNSSVKTIASIISGKNDISMEINDGRKTIQNVSTGWISKNNSNLWLQSDIFVIWGMHNNVGNSQSDLYTLAISYPAKVTGPVVLLSMDSSGNWIRAVDYNFGGKPAFVNGPFKTGFTLGTFGTDSTNHIVWAVLNYGGKFAVGKIPKTAH